MKTDILIEPEVKGSEQLYKEIYIVIHTAYIVYTMTPQGRLAIFSCCDGIYTLLLVVVRQSIQL